MIGLLASNSRSEASRSCAGLIAVFSQALTFTTHVRGITSRTTLWTERWFWRRNVLPQYSLRLSAQVCCVAHANFFCKLQS